MLAERTKWATLVICHGMRVAATATSRQAPGIWVPNSSTATSTASKLDLGRSDVVELY